MERKPRIKYLPNLPHFRSGEFIKIPPPILRNLTVNKSAKDDQRFVAVAF